MEDPRFELVRSILRSPKFRTESVQQQIVTLKKIESSGVRNQDMMRLIMEANNEEKVNRFKPAKIIVADLDKLEVKKKINPRAQVLKIDRPFQVGDIVQAEQVIGSYTTQHGVDMTFGVIDRITPTGKLRISTLRKERGNTLPVQGYELKTLVYPVNEVDKNIGSMLVDINGNNAAQHLYYKLYDPNQQYYDVKIVGYDY